MSNMSIEKFKVVEKIKLSYLKHRGNLLAVVEETELPIDYIKKIVGKLKKQEDRNVSVLISNTLMSHLMLGYESRVTNLMEMVKRLDGRDQNKVSICCEAPVRRNRVSEEHGYEDYECTACDARCSVKVLDKESILNIKIKLFEQLREEDKCLSDFAGKMGYTNHEPPPPPPPVQRNQFLVINGKEKDIVEDYNKLHPMEKERLVEKLRKEIVDIDVQLAQTATTEETDN